MPKYRVKGYETLDSTNYYEEKEIEADDAVSAKRAYWDSDPEVVDSVFGGNNQYDADAEEIQTTK